MIENARSSVGIMQPYIFPYIGYFQLAHAVDHFVFYDDVQYIKGGWINRNRISNGNEDPQFLTVPAVGRTKDAKILDVQSGTNRKWLRKLEGTLRQEYAKAPFFQPVAKLVEEVFADTDGMAMSELARRSVTAVFAYLDLPFQQYVSSRDFPNPEMRKRAERLVYISKKLGGDVYINLPGGVDLYHDADFDPHGVSLYFILDKSSEYTQFNDVFRPRLSIIDVLMHNSPETVRSMLNDYTLVKHDAL